MACILKLPDNTRGVISFTSPENREVILADPSVKNFLIENRKDWIYLLHHNWQPCDHDNFFDGSLCNFQDLNNEGYCLDMDCCNFSPSVYSPSKNEKSFDVFFVTRAVTFKRLEVFFTVCKRLLEKRPETKILLICSIPEVNCDPIDPRSIYLNMFTREERKNFLALFFDYDYPFTVDKHFLSHFYKSSKVFLHTASYERHPRVCSYAWSSGIPVVGYKDLSSFLPPKFCVPPFFYEVKNDSEYVDSIISAIESKDAIPYDDIKSYVNEQYSSERLLDKIREIHYKMGYDFDINGFYLKNLDFRMGRHCRISLGDNNLNSSIPDLMLKSLKYPMDTSCDDLEFELDQKN